MTYMDLSSSNVILDVILEFPTARCSEEPFIIPQSRFISVLLYSKIYLR